MHLHRYQQPENTSTTKRTYMSDQFLKICSITSGRNKARPKTFHIGRLQDLQSAVSDAAYIWKNFMWPKQNSRNITS